MMRPPAALMLLLTLAPAFAQEPPASSVPVIREIVFAGNNTTQPRVMLREMSVAVGDPADPGLIERSRQAILDLGLFNAVSVEQAETDGGVRLTITVREKWYILPIPRYSLNSDGKDSYGMSLRWFNVAGLNHTLRGSWSNSDDKKANKGRSTSYSAGYSMPFVFESPYSVSFGLGRTRTPIIAGPGYLETFVSGSVSLSRTFADEAASQGLTLGGSVLWSNQDTDGSLAPQRYGMATGLGLSADYRDVRFKVYSEEGFAYGIDVIGAAEGALSDYSFNSVVLGYNRYLAVGATPHQNVNFHVRAGSYHGGPQGVKSDNGIYNLGGASSLRGYGSDEFVGDAFYYAAAEYLRPVGWNWLRGVAILEVGNAFADAHSAQFRRIVGSVGLGLRVRLITFVNVEVEIGLAWPLEGGGSRFFASRV